MKRELMLMFLLVPNMLFGMDKKENAVLHKLHLILTAGRYVYGEHKTVHADVIARIRMLNDSYEADKSTDFIQSMHGYAHLLGKVAKIYREDTPLAARDAQLLTVLNTCHLDCVTWAMALSEGKEISVHSFTQLMAAFKRKEEKAYTLFRQAEKTQDAFSSFEDLTASLPRQHAITAWYIQFPPIMLQDDAGQEWDF